MDALVKRNIIKKSKVIVDIGSKCTKLLEVSYTAKRILVTGTHKIESESFFDGKTLKHDKLVYSIKRLMKNRKIPELSVSLPADMVDFKIIGIKNKKPSEHGMHIDEEHSTFGKVNAHTHELDYGYLGVRELNDDSFYHCLLATVNKREVTELTKTFLKKGLKLTTVSFPVYDLICLSQIFAMDCDHRNKLLIDYGTSGTRIVAISDNVPIYARNINLSFENIHFDNDITNQLENEIVRVLEFCESNGLPVSKIIWGDCPASNFEERFQSKDIVVEKADFRFNKVAYGKAFTMQITASDIDSSYNNALGLAINTLM